MLEEGPAMWCSARQREVLHGLRMEEGGDVWKSGKHRGQCVRSPGLFQVMGSTMCGMRTAGRGFQRDFPDRTLGVCVVEISGCSSSLHRPSQ